MSNNYTCDFCNQEIKERVFVSLNSGVYFHTAHFRCSVCESNLSEKPYYKKAKKYFCEDDYHKLYSPCCEVCKGPIKEQYITAFGKPFHIEHFDCTKCHSKFIDGQYYKVDNQAFCKGCYSNFAGICDYCQKFIIEKMVNVGRKNFHKECLHCAKCNSNDFPDDLYYEKKDKIYHENCYKETFYEKCSLCKNFCENEYISIESKPFHNECLELYKEYAKKLIDEELAGKEQVEEEEQEEQENIDSSKKIEKDNEISEVIKKPSQELEDPKKDNASQLRSSIRKKEAVVISNQKVSFHMGEMLESSKENNENDNEVKLFHNTNTLTPQMEIKIRNSIKMLENDIKTLEITQKKSAVYRNSNILRFSNQRKDQKQLFWSYHVLRNSPPKEIDLLKREHYLADEEFENVFKMKKSQFYSMPKWRQIDLKKKYGLF